MPHAARDGRAPSVLVPRRESHDTRDVRLLAAGCIAICVGLASPCASYAQATSVADGRRGDAGYLSGVGMGLTIGGIATTAGGTALVFAIGPGNGFGAAIGGGLLWGVGGALGLAGIPTWIVGSVRANVLAAREEDRARVAWGYELAGIVTTLAGIGIILAGGALMAAGMATLQIDLTGTGGALIPIGYFVSTFIGPPLWAEGGRS